MRLSLRIKLILSYFLLSLFIISSLYVATNYTLEKNFHNYVMEQREEHNKEILEAVTAEFESGTISFKTLRAISDRAMGRRTFIQVDDPSGREIFRSGPRMSSGGHRHEQNSTKMGMMWAREQQPNSDRSQRKAYPIIVQNVPVATLYITCPFEFNNADYYFTNMMSQILIRVAIGFLIVAAFVGIYMANRIANPLKKVIKQTQEIEKGNYSVSINSRSNTTELDELISSVNTLARTLGQQMQSKKRMARDYAHEIRTPLAAIQSNLEGMIDQVLDTTPERLESCRAEILRISRMISEVDKLVEFEDNNYKLRKSEIDLSALLSKILISFDKEMLDKQITLQTSMKPTKIFADADKLSQVFVNIISNAVKYTPANGSINVSISSNNPLQIVISDNGIGISAKDLPHIFDHLYRADLSRTRDTGGSGIGLSVAKAIVEAHGGSIKANSELGQGSTFVVSLPYN